MDFVNNIVTELDGYTVATACVSLCSLLFMFPSLFFAIRLKETFEIIHVVFLALFSIMYHACTLNYFNVVCVEKQSLLEVTDVSLLALTLIIIYMNLWDIHKMQFRWIFYFFGFALFEILQIFLSTDLNRSLVVYYFTFVMTAIFALKMFRKGADIKWRYIFIAAYVLSAAIFCFIWSLQFSQIKEMHATWHVIMSSAMFMLLYNKYSLLKLIKKARASKANSTMDLIETAPELPTRMDDELIANALVLRNTNSFLEAAEAYLGPKALKCYSKLKCGCCKKCYLGLTVGDEVPQTSAIEDMA